MSIRARFWSLRFARWGRRRPQSSGYTLLLPVPGDLPVFLDLALQVCRLQEHGHRRATLVLPDRMTPVLAARVTEAAREWPGGLRVVRLPAVDRLVLPRLGDPGRNHGAQLIRGATVARTSHVLLHDADLFLMDSRVHEDEYEEAVACDLDVLGVSPPWDDWYRDRGRALAATWELCARVDWMRAFRPHRHLGHDAVVDGEQHTFDTTFWPQLHTDQVRVAVGDGLAERIVHLNYVISTYRAFERSTGPFHDDSFRLLLIRIFVELFGRPEDSYGLPDLPDLMGGLGVVEARVHYLVSDREAYRGMRAKLEVIVAGPWSDATRAERCAALLTAFDEFYGVAGRVPDAPEAVERAPRDGAGGSFAPSKHGGQ